ncbi:MAG: hypothetical protein LBQ79_08255 [Deltaproteobacteria bacterium]|jgi:hypothetical protein|nr:hypothetical protein [Deltaproteobacteria bacterium]
MTDNFIIQGRAACSRGFVRSARNEEATLQAVRNNEETVKAFYDWLYPDGDWPELVGLTSQMPGQSLTCEAGTPVSRSVIASVKAVGSDIARAIELLGAEESPDKPACPSSEREIHPSIRVDEIGDIAVGMSERGLKAELAMAMELLEEFADLAGDTSVIDRVRGIVGTGPMPNVRRP